VPYGDVDALAERIAQLLESPEQRARMSQNALRWARQFDWDLSAQKTLAIIKEIELAKT
jgi:glycosyltransferase involved in cell wall biosynthesis